MLSIPNKLYFFEITISFLLFLFFATTNHKNLYIHRSYWHVVACFSWLLLIRALFGWSGKSVLHYDLLSLNVTLCGSCHFMAPCLFLPPWDSFRLIAAHCGSTRFTLVHGSSMRLIMTPFGSLWHIAFHCASFWLIVVHCVFYYIATDKNNTFLIDITKRPFTCIY